MTIFKPKGATAPLSISSEMEFIEKQLNPNLLLVKGLTMADASYGPPRLGGRTVFLYDLFARVEAMGGFAKARTV